MHCEFPSTGCIAGGPRGILKNVHSQFWKEVSPLIVEYLPSSAIPGISRLAQAALSGQAAQFYPHAPILPALGSAHLDALHQILATQNPGAQEALDGIARGAGALVTGQQVGLYGGPLFTPLKAATAIAHARQRSLAGKPHVAIFWLASEDHDFAEINHTTLPGKHELVRLAYTAQHPGEVPVGSIAFDDSITALVEQAAELIGSSDATEALQSSYRPGRTFAQAFADFYAKVFAAEGLLIFDPHSRAAHRLGVPVLEAAIERADELHAALIERSQELIAADYTPQVLVGEQSSLLFLINANSGAREALKRTKPTAAEPDGLWQAGADRYSTAELLGILTAEPERISPSALLRPVFQDFLLPTSTYIGGNAEIAYFAQSEVLYRRIIGRVTPIRPRLSATLIEPAIVELMKRYEIELSSLFGKTVDDLAQRLGARALPIEGKRKLASAGNALDAELNELVAWMKSVDAGLGSSGERSASKMRYQMNRMRRLAARFALEKETALARHAEAMMNAVYPDGHLQERVIGAPYFLAKYGSELTRTFVDNALTDGHALLWL